MVASQVSFDDGCAQLEIPRYTDSAELKNWYRYGDFFVGQSHHPWYVRYLWDIDVKIPLVFMSSIEKRNKIFFVYRDRRKMVSVSSEVV